jgi:hypothetical protein
MHCGGRMNRLDGPLAERQRIVAALALLGSMCAVVSAQIDVNETGLHDGQEVYGLYAPATPIPYVNPEDITLLARGAAAPSPYTDVSFSAYGLFNDNGGADNNGRIAVAGVGGTVDTGGRATANTAATGLSADGDAGNTGSLTITTTGGTATATASGNVAYAYTYAYAYGLAALGTVNNSGSMTITATGGTATATSDTALYVGAFADVFANAIVADNGVNNSGSLAVTAAGGTAISDGSALAEAVADGIWAGGALNNSGNITVTATGGTAAGSYASAGAQASGMTGFDLSNTAAVTVVAAGGAATADGVADTSCYAEGISASTVYNTGPVFVTAAAGTSDGTNNRADADAVGITVGGDVYNTGRIMVIATAGEGSASIAYGIRVNSPANLTNTAIIRATADTAYELYVASNTTTLFNTYNVTLDGDPSRASLGVADGATLALNDATLSVAGVSREIRWDTEYKLFETGGAGAVAGSFGDVQSVNPNATVTYYDQATAGSADDTVALAYTPVASPMLASTAVLKQTIFQAADVVNNHMTMTLLQSILAPPSSGLLVSAGSTAESLALAKAASDETAGVFVEPYYSRLDRDADPLGFDASLWGFSAGFERFLGNTLLNLHAGYGQSDIEYTGAGYSGNSEDQDVVTGGVSALTRWDPWTLRYGLTGFYGRHDYQGLTGLSLDERETASYDSYGAAATLMAGRIFRRGPHVFLPEAGLNWVWTHRRRYTTDATAPNWDTTYSAMDDHDLQAAASLRWLSSFFWYDTRVTPSISLGVRHLLTDAETSVRQSVAGAAPVLVESEQDRTAMTVSASLVLTRAPHAVSLAYDGDYSPNAQRHSVWLRYSCLF